MYYHQKSNVKYLYWKFTEYFTSKAVINIVYDKFFEVLYFLKIHLCHSLKKL